MVLVQNDNFGDRAFFLRPRIARGEGEKVNLVVSSADLEFVVLAASSLRSFETPNKSH